jgi:flagellar hook-associated protein 1 FlgK
MPDILSTGSSALLAFQRALSTISHNVANANTPGYTRQRVELAARPGQHYGFGFVGGGVQAQSVRRVIDDLAASRTLASAGELGRLSQLAASAQRLDAAFTSSATGIAAPLSNFFDAAQSVSANPSSPVARQGLVANAQALATRFRSLDTQAQSLDRENEQRLAAGVEDVNRLSAQIAQMNDAIARQTGAANGNPPNDLLDRRDELVRTLAGKIGVTTAMQDDGSLNVTTQGGQALVAGRQSQRLSLVADAYQPTRSHVMLAGDSAPLPDAMLGGELGGLMAFRRDVIDPARQQLGRLAAGLAQTFNAQHRLGVDQYGQPGSDFFTGVAPSVLAASTNAGSGAVAASIADPAALDGADIVMAFDGSAWRARDAGTGATLAMTGSGTAADPFHVGGLALTTSGGAVAGDTFLVRPTASAASQIGVATTDPARIAAASALRASAATGNTGSGVAGSVTIADPSDPSLRDPVTVAFTGPNTYSINGSGSYTYTPGSPIAANGWRFDLSGTPAAGDSFAVGPNDPRSGDNGNARALAGLGEAGLFGQGMQSLTQATAQLTSTIGSAARQADLALDAQQAIDTQLADERAAVSGVNLDEEAANLVRYQQAYQAAAQVISIANENFQTLLGAVHR